MKRVMYVDKFKNDEKLIKILSIVAISGLVSSTVLSCGVIYLLNNNDKLPENNVVIEQEEVEKELVDDGKTVKVFDINDNNADINLKSIDFDSIVEYEEIRVKPTVNKVYELPTGFELRVKDDGSVYGFRFMDKIDGSSDYIKRFYPIESGYSIIDKGACVEVRIIPREIISYSVPEGFTLVQDESGIYAYKMVPKPIVKRLS